ncbi:MAG: TetR/AcrR family transcriptional regulator [Proteobacteria bacterium]|nr:TetR/AcrR family transcriptional regulator [Pseudomonadota bacterium]
MSAARKTTNPEKAPRRGARVQHILGESLECFAESGFERVTYDELIARSKVSRGSFYWYFPSKEALYEAVLDYCANGYVARLEEQFAKTDPKDHVVKRLLDTSLADFNANRSQYRLLLRPPPPSPEAIRKMTQWNDDTLAFMRSKLEPAVKAGKLDREMANTLPDVLSAFIDGVCVRLVLEDENSVSKLSKNIERFLCRIVEA